MEGAGTARHGRSPEGVSEGASESKAESRNLEKALPQKGRTTMPYVIVKVLLGKSERFGSLTRSQNVTSVFKVGGARYPEAGGDDRK